MAAPATVTLKNLNGDFIMNKKLSDDPDPILTLQGVGWLTRKAISLATLTLHIKEYDDDKGDTHIDIEQTATGGIKGTTELRTLNWEEGEHEDHVFGRVRGRSRYIKLADVEDEFLKTGWLPEMSEGDTEVVQSYVESVNNGWTANQIWGFEEVNGERRYVRHAVVVKGEKRLQARLVYDFVKYTFYVGAGAYIIDQLAIND